MPEAATPRVERLAAGALAEVRPLLIDLLAEDEGRYAQERGDRAGIDGLVGRVEGSFAGENLVLGVREGAVLVAFCWCVFFDPGTGYEAEVAEVYVRPEHRGRGLASALVSAAVRLFRERSVTFAAVWTHPTNATALRLYQSAGFAPTEQVVLTWLPGGR